jgi:hypothetical protein
LAVHCLENNTRNAWRIVLDVFKTQPPQQLAFLIPSNKRDVYWRCGATIPSSEQRCIERRTLHALFSVKF